MQSGGDVLLSRMRFSRDRTQRQRPCCAVAKSRRVRVRSGRPGGGRGQGRPGAAGDRAVGDRQNVFPRACVAGIVYPVLHRASNMPRGKTGVRIFSASPVGFQRFVSTVRTEVSFTDRSVDRSLLPEEVIYAAELARAPAPCCRNRRLAACGRSPKCSKNGM